MLAALSRLWARYERVGQALVAGTICAVGDVTCQSFELLVYDRVPGNKSNTTRLQEGFDFRRFTAVSAFGFCISGPFGSFWYPFLDRLMHTRFPHLVPGSWRFVGTKFFFEQALYGPLATALFFPCVSLVEGGESLSSLPTRMKKDYLPALAFDEAMWTFVSPLTFKFLPVNRQLMFNSCVSAVENMGLSFIQHRGFQDLPFTGAERLATHAHAGHHHHSHAHGAGVDGDHGHWSLTTDDSAGGTAVVACRCGANAGVGAQAHASVGTIGSVGSEHSQNAGAAAALRGPAAEGGAERGRGSEDRAGRGTETHTVQTPQLASALLSAVSPAALAALTAPAPARAQAAPAGSLARAAEEVAVRHAARVELRQTAPGLHLRGDS